MEKLEVEGGFSGAEGGSMNPIGKVGHWSARTKTTEEDGEEVKRAENTRSRERRWTKRSLGMQQSSNEADGGVIICEVEKKQQAACVEVQGPRRRVIRVQSQEMQDYVRESLAISQEEAVEIGFCAKCFN